MLEAAPWQLVLSIPGMLRSESVPWRLRKRIERLVETDLRLYDEYRNNTIRSKTRPRDHREGNP